jgi:acyl-CoA reductase-like NAD-dependent aldehyde dehydrogenase
MTNTTSELERQIEQMVAAHVAALRKAAQGAVERAFAAASAAAQTVAPSRPRAARAAGKRRAGAELSALGERFFEALSRKPGETMGVLSAEVGASPQELHRAVGRLREAGRVKTVGERSAMRYFPLAASAAS